MLLFLFNYAKLKLNSDSILGFLEWDSYVGEGERPILPGRGTVHVTNFQAEKCIPMYRPHPSINRRAGY